MVPGSSTSTSTAPTSREHLTKSRALHFTACDHLGGRAIDDHRMAVLAAKARNHGGCLDGGQGGHGFGAHQWVVHREHGDAGPTLLPYQPLEPNPQRGEHVETRFRERDSHDAFDLRLIRAGWEGGHNRFGARFTKRCRTRFEEGAAVGQKGPGLWSTKARAFPTREDQPSEPITINAETQRRRDAEVFHKSLTTRCKPLTIFLLIRFSGRCSSSAFFKWSSLRLCASAFILFRPQTDPSDAGDLAGDGALLDGPQDRFRIDDDGAAEQIDAEIEEP